MRFQIIFLLFIIVYNVNGQTKITRAAAAAVATTNGSDLYSIQSLANKSYLSAKNRSSSSLDSIIQLSKLSKIKLNKKKKNLQQPKLSKGINHIKSIYNSLQNGNAIFNDQSINTIRYVPAVKVDSTKKLYFLFNLSMLTSSEHLIKSDLFINRKYIKQKLEFNLHYFLYSTFNNKRNENSTSFNKLNKINNNNNGGTSATIYLKNIKHDKYQGTWQSFNILDSINSYLSIRNTKQFIDATKQKQETNKNVYYTYSKDGFVNITDQQPDELVLIMEAANFKSNKKSNKNLADVLNPYLMIYSNENESNMKNFFQSKVAAAASTASKLDDLKTFESQVDKLNESFDSNELSDITTPTTSSSSTSTTTKTAITTSKVNIDKNNQSLNITSSVSKLSAIESYLIEKSKQNDPYFNYLPKEHQISKRSNDQDENENENDSMHNNVFDNHFSEVISTESESECSKHSITVDFEDMSFSDWILEPKRFPSNYCSGICKFPFSQKATYSNYAALQNILNSISLNNNKNTPPELCCSPSTVESLPILFIDKNSADYVVKLLPDMVVKDCSCR